ncbi:MAG: hypothetical protein CM15mP19_07630 [Gammaproteobacteria bacterium]|nr:MAG: hypothetical protein CM15mP19_07630 [Gammaproteobacteria bacterium]
MGISKYITKMGSLIDETSERIWETQGVIIMAILKIPLFIDSDGGFNIFDFQTNL